MIRYNFTRIFRARGVSKPYSYLLKSGFSDKLATKIKNNAIRRLDLGTLERLCLLLSCTPNDLLEWIPENDVVVNEDHPLNEIRKSANTADIFKTLNSVPLGKLKEIEELIKEKLQG